MHNTQSCTVHYKDVLLIPASGVLQQLSGGFLYTNGNNRPDLLHLFIIVYHSMNRLEEQEREIVVSSVTANTTMCKIRPCV